MATLAFDTHKAVKALCDAGFDASQAEAVTEQIGIAIGENLATKDDLWKVRSDLQAVMKNLRSDLQAEMKSLRSDLQAEMKNLRSDMEKLELRMTNKLYAAVAAGVGLVKALDFLIG